MEYVLIEKKDGIATVTLNRGKVNALNNELVEQLYNILENLKTDINVKAIILTGQGKFFSFGFDIPEFLKSSKEVFVAFLMKFTALYAYLYRYPKPVIAALNGHAVAGGCILAMVCDYRLMVTGKAKISLNEVTFGASLFAGCIDILRKLVGQRNAETILLTGAMFTAEEALKMGLIDSLSSEETLLGEARQVAQIYIANYGAAFNCMKKLVRTVDWAEYDQQEQQSIDEFIKIWYSEDTMKNLTQIKIHS